MIKIPQKTGYRMNLYQHNISVLRQIQSQHHTEWGKAEIISSNIRNKTKMSTFKTLTQHSIGSLSQSNKARERSQTEEEKRRSYYPCLQDNMIFLNIERPKMKCEN